MLITWDIYEIRCDCAALHGVKLRGRIRKFCLEKEISCLVENASDEENVVRFALVAHANPQAVSEFVTNLVPEAKIIVAFKEVANPVLSKLNINDPSRYEI